MKYQAYSKRNREMSDIYQYDFLPDKLRKQVELIVDRTFGEDSETGYKFIVEFLEEEHGLNIYPAFSNYRSKLLHYIEHAKSLEVFLDTVEITFRCINVVIKNNAGWRDNHRNSSISAEDAMIKLNERFLENSLGYQFIDNIIVKLDNKLHHTEIVVPTVNLLSNPVFAHANEEYIKAHIHYKNGLNKECITECVKALESTLKVILTEKGWEFNTNKDTLSTLFKIAEENGLIPSPIKEQLTGLRTILTSGVATIRNRISAHGAGAVLVTADDETTRFALNTTGANIIYLIELSKI